MSARLLLRWWFPRADTPTCTRQANALAEAFHQDLPEHLDVVGCSLDPQPVLDAWGDALGLPFPLQSMTLEQAQEYGAARPASDPWHPVMAARVATLVDDTGAQLDHWTVQDPTHFATEVATHVRAVRAGQER